MQSAASIMVYSGNRPMASQNKMLGQFNIDITPSPKGVNQIEVSFDIDANGILTVSAVDKALNKPNKITIESSSNLTKEEIERMKAEAEANADADKKLKETADKINMADSMAFSIEKSMDEMKDKIDDADKEEIKKITSNLKKAASERNVSDIEKYQKELEAKWSPIVQKVYQSQQTAQPTNENTTSANEQNTDNKKKEDWEEVK